MATLFVFLFAIVFARQAWVQTIEGPHLRGNVHDPRTALLAAYRGPILARDGTQLAYSNKKGRHYPFGGALAQTVGYASQRYGTSGLEAAFDEALTARPAANDPLTALTDAFSNRPAQSALEGASVITTIDPSVQAVLAKELSNYERAAGVALDPRTGEVLAIASVPSFDPALVDTDFAALTHDGTSPLLNRAANGLYPPGSTFKIFTASAALDADVVQMSDTFEDPGYLVVGNATLHDNEGEATGRQDLTGAFALSSNVDYGQIAIKLGADRWFDAAERWKLGESLGFTIPASRDHLPTRAEMSDGILAQLGFGQADLLVTPLRMAVIAATIAAGGTEPQPFLVRSLRVGGNEETVEQPNSLAVPISAEVAADVTSMMVAVVQRGTGTAAALPDVQVAGKTGTATNPAGTSHAWFVAFAPAQAPRVAVAIVVENAGYGGAVAAPIARDVIRAALATRR